MTTEARREQLLAFGRRHFAEHGYEAMSMDAIADRAGVSKGLLYHYFGNQRGFYMETVRSVTDEVIAITEPPAEQPFDQAFRVMVTCFVGYVQEHSAIYAALVRGGLGSDTEVNELLDRVRTTTMSRILEGWVSLIENGCAEWTAAGGASPSRLIDFFISAFEPVLEVLQSEQRS
jgi:AcrR family transcriptional regulator